MKETKHIPYPTRYLAQKNRRKVKTLLAYKENKASLRLHK